MVIIVTGSFIHLAEKLIVSTEKEMHLIKRRGVKSYFYYSGPQSYEQIANHLKKLLRTQLSAVYVFEIFSLYQGMTDYSPWLSVEQKAKQAYYNQPKKEVSEEELQKFLASKGLR